MDSPRAPHAMRRARAPQRPKRRHREWSRVRAGWRLEEVATAATTTANRAGRCDVFIMWKNIFFYRMGELRYAYLCGTLGWL